MSKGLEALERAKKEHSQLTQGFPDNEYLWELNKIETALKALELLKKNLVIAFEEDNGIDLPTLVVGIKINKNKLCVIYSTQDKEEIKILKEVLL